jgi:hypothetical protein
MNGLCAKDMENEDANRILATIIKDSETNLDYESHVAKHPTEPLLTKYFYKHDMGETESTSEFKQVQVKSSTGDASSTFVQAVSGNAQTVVKIENPGLLQIKQKLVVLKSAKATLEKCLSQGLDLEGALDAKSKTDVALIVKTKEVTKAMAGLSEFIKELRAFIAALDLADGSTDLNGTNNSITEMEQASVNHQDGFKLMNKRLKVFL